jgi:hypothetical protein
MLDLLSKGLILVRVMSGRVGVLFALIAVFYSDEDLIRLNIPVLREALEATLEADGFINVAVLLDLLS